MLDLSGTRTSDTAVGYFAYFKLLNGFEKILYMTKDDVAAWGERYSPSYRSAAEEKDHFGVRWGISHHKGMVRNYGAGSGADPQKDRSWMDAGTGIITCSKAVYSQKDSASHEKFSLLEL